MRRDSAVRDGREIRVRFPHCWLIVRIGGPGVTFEVRGLPWRESLSDRERIAAEVAAHLGIDHEEAYDAVWVNRRR